MEDTQTKIKKVSKKLNLMQVAIGIIIGILVFSTIRFIAYTPPKHTHYHANLAVYIDGQREKFESPFYYEEVTVCNLDAESEPEHRVHMHGNVNDLIHVHADAVTWGNFFQNIGWNIGKNYIDNTKQIFQNDADKKLIFMINGEVVVDITTRVIGNTDKLLVNYGSESKDELKQRSDSVASSAKQANETQDPASCSGSHEETTVKDRFKNIL